MNTTNTNFTPMPAKVSMSLDGKFQVATIFKNQVTSRIAGTGTVGFSGDGGAATSAQLNFQSKLVFDASNNITFSDGYNHRIRRINASTGIITTIVGSATTGFPANGTASSQNLQFPFGVSIDASGSYICNCYHGVFKITGTTLTVIGGSGTSSFLGDGSAVSTSTRFGSPQQNCIDSSGNIYIADGANRRIRRIAVGTNIITTICGNGNGGSTGDGGAATSATLNPTGICVDKIGRAHV